MAKNKFDYSQADDSTDKESPEEDMDIYDEDQAEEMESEDEIDEIEEGFIHGYEEGAKMAKCPQCGTVLEQTIIEEEIKGETYRYCSTKCATKFDKGRR